MHSLMIHAAISSKESRTISRKRITSVLASFRDLLLSCAIELESYEKKDAGHASSKSPGNSNN